LIFIVTAESFANAVGCERSVSAPFAMIALDASNVPGKQAAGCECLHDVLS
jgi:hypothetical protein